MKKNPHLETFETYKNSKKIFFVGIGGISMSSLARYAKDDGKTVSGSDRTESDLTRALEASGIGVIIGHDGKNVSGFDMAVYTGAIGDDNPEICAAKAAGIPVFSRAEFLGAIMLEYPVRVGISGSHGKSTATAMTAHVLLLAGKNPTVLCGAASSDLDGAYRRGERSILFEACEYKDSFLEFSPNIAVILGADYDHVDYFKNERAVIDSFSKFAKISSDDGGSVIVCADDKGAVEATKNEFAITFGIDEEADYKAENVRFDGGFARFDVLRTDEEYISVSLSVPGKHNIYNALAAIAVCDLMGVPADVISAAVSDFSGIPRRFEHVCDKNGVKIYTDYAHHPKEIAETLKTAKSVASGRIITVFEPHTYSRTAVLFDAFVRAFDSADVKIFTDIYAARETDTMGVSGEKLAIAAGGKYVSSYVEAANEALAAAQSGDMILILGAGTVSQVADIIGG
ncbi:MAG: UDP-N-acetylmuramate--L-alanine ligase [Clostridiales bacterium]|nr:UDP-N-acetylmuramate--L-alanine ligase [Clostridiales bacterium]